MCVPNVGDLLPQRGDLLRAGVAERPVEGDEQLGRQRVGQAVHAVVVDRGRDVLRHGDVVVPGDQDDLEADRDGRAVGAAGERVGLVACSAPGSRRRSRPARTRRRSWTVLSVVLTASAWLSPSPGASGLLNGNTHGCGVRRVPGRCRAGASWRRRRSAWLPSAAPAAAPVESPVRGAGVPRGTSTSASCGCSRVGRASPSAQPVTSVPCWPSTRPDGRRADGSGHGDPGRPARACRPRRAGSGGRCRAAATRPTPARRPAPAATRPATPRRTGLPRVRRQTDRDDRAEQAGEDHRDRQDREGHGEDRDAPGSDLEEVGLAPGPSEQRGLLAQSRPGGAEDAAAG